ncbi:DUF2461 domain-containing protein [Candidatus Omnitrophota bacterium]
MSSIEEFKGFPELCITFFRELSHNNNTIWFKEHKNDYEEYVLNPCRLFVTEMGERLRGIAPAIIADPRVNRSLFRINRDTRFSKNKIPYKTHCALWFWEGSAPRMENSGFYLHLEPEKLMLGTGIYCFQKPQLEKFRSFVVDKKHGPALVKAIEKTTKSSSISLGGSHYKRIPRGFDPKHANASLLLHNGLYVGEETPVPEVLFTAELIDYCFERFNCMKTLHRWLVTMNSES